MKNPGVLPNIGEESLRHEFYRLGGEGDPEKVISELGFTSEIIDYPTLNTGAVGASVENWEKMRSYYNINAFKVKKYFNHYARQQFLMSLITYAYFDLIKMPKYTHCDGHYRIPDSISSREKKWVYDDGNICAAAYYCHGGILMDGIYDEIRIAERDAWIVERDAQIVRLKRVIESMENSRIWRLTWPIRNLHAKLLRIFPKL